MTAHTLTMKTTDKLSYQQITARFSKPVDCLTAHLMLECSETLTGIKPANLVSIVNRIRPCGRNLYQVWQAEKDELAGIITQLRFKVLQTTERAVLVFCYNPTQLERHLSHSGIRVLLEKAGYNAALPSGELLEELARRVAASDQFPHEIGLFIGYPAKDVAAFMGLVKLPFTCQGPWKIFGNPEKSLCLARTFQQSRQVMINQLSNCNSPRNFLAEMNDNKERFFYH